LVSYLKEQNNSVLLAAADTFRAAAVEQLETWGGRLGVEVITGPPNGDPASVAFEAATKAKSAGINY
jgi:fused signal recognition particle receptor